MKIGIEKAADISEMTPQNLRYLIKRSKGPECEMVVGRRVFEEKDVREWYVEYKKNKKKK